MNKVEPTVAIPKPGRKNPESEHSPVVAKSGQSDQPPDDQQLMPVEIALVRALQQLGSSVKIETQKIQTS
jgi:hypothetical protein